ncbi:alpha/beta hydrolase [uncultured Legionella sp.]|uniref:alpha/beta fold hydrolase n=1 Tax=uncultured Legionella sp. TaxID=210934 RepID=UPI002637F376|nr:alpha/beta hydrolase [uncultured Legionella sp.]
MPNINANGINIYYELRGQGQPLVLIAGYTGDHTFWKLMQEELAKQFTVLLFDNRGIGQTLDSGADFSLELMAEDTMALINALGLEHPHIIGQSMGGAIAQMIARTHGQHIDKLIILNSAAKLNVRTINTLNNIYKLREAQIPFDLFIDTALPWFFSSHFLANPELIKAFKEDLLKNPFPQSISDQERQLKALLPFDSRNWLKDIHSSTLVIAAEEDIIALPEESKELAQCLPDAQFKIIPGAHSSPVEQANTVNELILNFIS